MKEMQIDSIRVSLMNYQHVVILKERQTDRYLPIWIGPAEADAISMKLQNVDVSRPMTHDLLKNTFSALASLSGTNISRIVVNDLRSDRRPIDICIDRCHSAGARGGGIHGPHNSESDCGNLWFSPADHHGQGLAPIDRAGHSEQA